MIHIMLQRLTNPTLTPESQLLGSVLAPPSACIVFELAVPHATLLIATSFQHAVVVTGLLCDVTVRDARFARRVVLYKRVLVRVGEVQ